MSSKWILLGLTLLSVAPSIRGTWSMLFYPFQWIRDMVTSRNTAEFNRRIGELEEYNATFLNDSRHEMQLWPNRTSANFTESNLTESIIYNSTAFWNDSVEESTLDDNVVVANEDEDKWKDYFEQLLTHDTEFCFSLLVCEISAKPDNFLEYGRRVARFFQTYRPSTSNSAAWWYVQAAEVGRKGRSLAECKANYPFCFVDTRQLVALLDVPPPS